MKIVAEPFRRPPLSVYRALDVQDRLSTQKVLKPWYRIVKSMEILLNLSWALLSVLTVCLWMCLESRTGAGRRMSFISLVMLIVILFPVISVSDDLWSIQNPAETDTCLRRAHEAASAHPTFPCTAALAEPVFAAPRFGFQRFAAPLALRSLAIDNPALNAIKNRPPPAA